MLYGILSDVQGKFDTLRHAVKSAHQEGVNRFLCLGDIIHNGETYEEERCVQLLRNMSAITVRGNHDNVPQKSKLSSDSINYLHGLPLRVSLGSILLYHDSIRDVTTRTFTLEDATEELSAIAKEYPIARTAFRGHTHTIQAFIRKGFRTQYGTFKKRKITCNEEGIYLLSPGSLGMPDQDNKPSYGIFDTTTKEFRINLL